METIKEDDILIEYTKEEKHYSCYIPEHDLYFSSMISKGIETVIRKAKAMIQCKKNFLEEFPEYN